MKIFKKESPVQVTSGNAKHSRQGCATSALRPEQSLGTSSGSPKLPCKKSDHLRGPGWKGHIQTPAAELSLPAIPTRMPDRWGKLFLTLAQIK